MKTEITAGYITVEIENNDWKQRDVFGFLRELKAKIPIAGRTWDPHVRLWFIDETHKDIVYDLKKEYFVDKNQIQLEI